MVRRTQLPCSPSIAVLLRPLWSVQVLPSILVMQLTPRSTRRKGRRQHVREPALHRTAVVAHEVAGAEVNPSARIALEPLGATPMLFVQPKLRRKSPQVAPPGLRYVKARQEPSESVGKCLTTNTCGRAPLNGAYWL